MKKQYYTIGSISHGTMRDVDLIEVFTWELENLATRNKYIDHYQSMIDVAYRFGTLLMVHEDKLNKLHHKKIREWVYEQTSYIINEVLFNVLNTFAPPYFYFGSHPGDGADYGFWLSEDFEYCFEGLKVSDTSEIPKDYVGEILHINDHGNVTLFYKYRTSKKLHEIWAVV